MARLRFMITLLTIWLIFIFNIERYDFQDTNINLPTMVYIMSAFAVVLILAVPDFIAARWYFLLASILIVYGVIRYDDVIVETLPVPIAYLLEWSIITIAFTIGRWLSGMVAGIEQTYDTLVENSNNLRIMSSVDGEEATNRELFRARRFERPVSMLYIKTPSLKQLERIYNTYLPYQVSLQQRYLKSRIAQLSETLLYATDPLLWYGDDIVICLPETEKAIAYETAQRIAKVLHFSLNLDVPIGVATFPIEGLIFADLVEKAYNDLQYFTSDQIVGDDTSPIPTTSDDGDGDDNGMIDDREPNYDEITFSQTEPYQPEAKPTTLHTRIIEGLQQGIRNWYHSVEYEADLIPPQEIYFEEGVDGKIFYNPDFWVNRIPHQSAWGRQIYRRIKRAMDITLIVLASPFILLLFSIVGFLIWKQDRGPIFYSQLRTGEGAHKFRMYKFRSMVPDADKVKQQYGISTNERGETVDKHGNKLEPDPRVTRIGRFIRKTSIDELPQLYNVLRGEMSLVGPRPTTFNEDKYTSFQKERLSVKPGLTGLWQVYDRGDTDFDNRLVWDIKYIDKMSLWLDIQIIFRTVLMQVLKRRGA